MSRVALGAKKTLISAAALLVIAGGGVGLWFHSDSSSNKSTTNTSQSTVAKPVQTTSISYKGEDGQTALALLKKHAQVQTKSSSIGDYVTSINGNDGGGSKYWLFYVNGQESQVGASAYVTKSSDQIEWKLQ
jgi:hypothetical protein